jgi:hypothetical protein
VVEVFPVAIGYYLSPDLEDLDVETQVGHLVDLLAPFGGKVNAWAHPQRERGADAIQRRINEWATVLPLTSGDEFAGPDATGTPNPGHQDEGRSSVLYWVGHGWSDGHRAALAHAHSPARVGAAGVQPEQLAYVLRSRQTLREAVVGDADEDDWAIMVIDACRSTQVVEAITEALLRQGVPRRLMLVAVSADGATPLGRFTTALQNLLTDTFRAEAEIPLGQLGTQLERVLGDGNVYARGLGNARLKRTYQPVAAWMSAPMDTVRHLEDVLDDLSPDERWHFLAKAQGADQGEVSWFFFEGRHEETAELVAWLRDADSGMLVVSGRAGSGKSALLGNLLVLSLPELREALARRGLITLPPLNELPPAEVFDVVIHLSGLSLRQATLRIAAAVGFVPPSEETPSLGIANDIDALIENLRAIPSHDLPITILCDALDEAVDPLSIASSLLARLAVLQGIRVLVGTRASTNETPDESAGDQNLLDALAAGRAQISGQNMVPECFG